MKELMRNCFKTGIVHFMAYPFATIEKGDLIQSIKRIASDEYFDAIEITSVEPQEERIIIKEILTSSHMHVTFCAQIIQLREKVNVNDTNETKRKRAVDVIKKAVDQAYELSADSFAFMSGAFEKETISTNFEALIKSTLEICEYAKGKGNIEIALETFDSDID